jgi:hypothetical protein
VSPHSCPPIICKTTRSRRPGLCITHITNISAYLFPHCCDRHVQPQTPLLPYSGRGIGKFTRGIYKILHHHHHSHYSFIFPVRGVCAFLYPLFFCRTNTFRPYSSPNLAFIIGDQRVCAPLRPLPLLPGAPITAFRRSERAFPAIYPTATAVLVRYSRTHSLGWDKLSFLAFFLVLHIPAEQHVWVFRSRCHKLSLSDCHLPVSLLVKFLLRCPGLGIPVLSSSILYLIFFVPVFCAFLPLASVSQLWMARRRGAWVERFVQSDAASWPLYLVLGLGE